jgi:hypothetical protein
MCPDNTPTGGGPQRASLPYTLVTNKYDHEPKAPVEMMWALFVEQLKKFLARPPKPLKDGLAIIFAVFAADQRIRRANVTAVTALGVDVDGDPSKGQEYLAPEALHERMPFEMVTWSTYSSTPDAPRYRAVFPFDRPYTVAEFERIWHWANQQTGGRLMDPACKDPCRLFYTPRWPEGAEDRFVRDFAGPRLSLGGVPANFHPLMLGSGKPAVGQGRKRKQGAHSTSTSWAEAKALLEEMLRHPLIRWMREEPDAVGRETWRGVAQNLACAVLERPDLLERARQTFHELSEDYTYYSWTDTEKAFQGAIDSLRTVGPMTFQHMVDSGIPPHLVSAGATSLIHAARIALHVRLQFG